MAGLQINYKRGYLGLRQLVIVLLGILTIVAVWFGLQWYTTGAQPPVVPLPAVATANPSVDETPVTQEEIDEYTVPPLQPRYISIPVLGVNKVRVQTVGLTENNLLDTPKNISDTAWYKDSATPGQGYGVVVIDGHNGGVTRDGVFADLASLQNGDEIIIERGDGKKFRYVVVENKTESLEEVNKTGMQRLLTPYDKTKEGLGLITCAGNWVPRDKVFDKRVLVRAVISE